MKQTTRIIILVGLLGFVFPSIGFAPKFNTSSNIKRVVIDAGHGGHDPGNMGTGRYKKKEKSIALDVALLVGKYITENIPDVEVIYTRKTDHFVELKQRTVIANKAEADLFISIHCDAFTSSNAYGSSSFVQGMNHTDENMRVAKQENSVILLEEGYETKYEGFDPSKPETYIMLTMQQNAYFEQSISLAQKVQDQFRVRVHRKDRGVKQEPLYVTSRTTMPAILVELGFLTNHKEEDFLNTKNGKELMASAIYRAFKEYRIEVDNMEALKNSSENKSEVVEYYKENPPEEQVIKQDIIEPNTVVTTPAVDEGPFYAVQLATSSKDLELLPQNFSGLEGVERIEEYGLFKYYWAKDKSIDKVRKSVSEAKKVGYKDAYIIAFYKGVKIKVSEAQDIHP